MMVICSLVAHLFTEAKALPLWIIGTQAGT